MTPSSSAGASPDCPRPCTGEALESAKLVLAFGMSDELPAIPGLAERWGRAVLHCPYCHGYEFSGQRLGVLNVSPMSLHQAMLIAEWGPTTLYLNGASQPDDASLDQLLKPGVALEPAPVRSLHRGLPTLDYPFHDWTATVTHCGRICFKKLR